MFEYDSLIRHASAFRSLTGLNPDEFERLLADFTTAQQRLRAQDETTRAGRPRQRQAGAGHPHDHDDRHRLLMALIWLRLYPTYELLGLFFHLHRRNAQLNVRDILAVLDTLSNFPFDRPDATRRKLRSLDQVMATFPQVRLVIDGKEQRVQRPQAPQVHDTPATPATPAAGSETGTPVPRPPTDYETQKPYYSGKKKTHTLKNQIAVGPDGRIESVSTTVPGATHDFRLLRESGLMERLDRADGVLVDKGYDGISGAYPSVPVVIPFKARRGRPLTDWDQESNRVVSRHRIVVEHVMAQLNRFTVLRQVFRGHQRRHAPAHSQVVRVVAMLVNRRTEVCPLKSYGPTG